MTSTNIHRQLFEQANRIAIDADYTARQHFIVGQDWRRWATPLGLPLVIVSAASSGAAGLSALWGGETWITVFLGVLGAVVGGVKAFYKPEEQAKGHSAKGSAYLTIRNETRHFQNVELHTSADPAVLADRLKFLSDRYNLLTGQEPREIPRRVIDKVREQVKRGDYSYEDDPLWKESPF